MKFISFLTKFFWSRENRRSLFSESLEGALRDLFKEMGYQYEDRSKKELNKEEGQK